MTKKDDQRKTSLEATDTEAPRRTEEQETEVEEVTLVEERRQSTTK